MAKKFFWDVEIVSVDGDVLTLKGWEQKTFSKNLLRCITDKKIEANELKDMKLQIFQMLMFEAFDTLDLTDTELHEGVQLFQTKWTNDVQETIMRALGVSSYKELTYKTIHKG